jgi:hypothetical protein
MKELEKNYYRHVAKWLEKSHQCFKTSENTGLKYSRADVVGVRDIGGDLTGEIETIIVEVKIGTEAFATASGQTLGYKVYANRVFLADKRDDGFTNDEIQIASHLGIGLILINKKNMCQEILSSPYYKPLPKLNSLLLEKLRLGMCQLCHSYIEIGDEKRTYKLMERKNINKAVLEEKGYMFWNYEVGARKKLSGIRSSEKFETFERRFLCRDCISILGQLSK